jgi:hypothetical protein
MPLPFRLLTPLLTVLALCFAATGQANNDGDDADASPYAGLAWRNIGPAFMSGRIADIDWDPDGSQRLVRGVGSGGVWKTVNAGTTWTPVFDEQTVLFHR